MRSHSTQSPGPQYYPRHQSDIGASTNSARTAVSSGLASTLARRLPFDTGNSSSPGPSKYSPRSSAEFRGRGAGPTKPKSGVPTKGAAALGYTSPRFSNGHYNHARQHVPGPGAYNAGAADHRTLGSAHSASGRATPTFGASTEARKVEDFYGIRPTPGAAAYSPRSSARGISDMPPERRHTPSAAFSSGSKRLAAQQTLSPGPGGYTPYDGKATASIVVKGAARPVRRSASFGSSSSRFKQPWVARDTPGPGAYHQDLASPRDGYARLSGAANISASFASGSARTRPGPLSVFAPTHARTRTSRVPPRDQKGSITLTT